RRAATTRCSHAASRSTSAPGSSRRTRSRARRSTSRSSSNGSKRSHCGHCAHRAHKKMRASVLVERRRAGGFRLSVVTRGEGRRGGSILDALPTEILESKEATGRLDRAGRRNVRHPAGGKSDAKGFRDKREKSHHRSLEEGR